MKTKTIRYKTSVAYTTSLHHGVVLDTSATLPQPTIAGNALMWSVLPPHSLILSSVHFGSHICHPQTNLDWWNTMASCTLRRPNFDYFIALMPFTSCYAIGSYEFLTELGCRQGLCPLNNDKVPHAIVGIILPEL